MFNALLWNLLLTTAAALLISAASRHGILIRRPAVRQCLWLLLLVKLITPPLFSVPVLPPTAVAADTSPTDLATAAPSATPDRRGVAPPGEPVGEVAWAGVLSRAGTTDAPVVHDTDVTQRLNSGHGLVALSFLGSFFLLGIYATRIARMCQWLRRFGVADPTLGQMCCEEAAKLGIRSTVRSRVVDARTFPLLWGLFRPVVVLPRELNEHFPRELLRCIISHELAHYARCDHWTNFFVLLVKSIFWWNPVTWWAYREIRDAQESCCDAMAIDCTDTARRTYAATLLKALDYVQPELHTQRQPALHMSSKNSILRRFEMIGDADLSYRLTRFSLLALVVFAIPMFAMPVRSQEKEPDETVVEDRSLSVVEKSIGDEESVGDETGSEQVAKKEIKLAGKLEHLFLAGITRISGAGAGWVVNRDTGAKITISKGSVLRVGRIVATVEQFERHAVVLRVGQDQRLWKLGKPLSELVSTGTPVRHDSEEEVNPKRPMKGELAGGELSGVVQIEFIGDLQSIVLRGNKEDVERVEELLRQLLQNKSMPDPSEATIAKAATKQHVNAYLIAKSDLETARGVVNAIAQDGNLKVVIDQEKQMLIVLASPEDHKRIQAAFKKQGFAAPAKQPESRPKVDGASDKRLRFEFRFQPWGDVLKWFADAAGLSLVTDETVPGTFNYFDDREYSVVEALDLLNSVLLSKNRHLVIRDRALFVVDITDGIPEALVPHVKAEQLSQRGEFEFVTVHFPLGDRDSELVRQEIVLLLGPHGRSVILPQSRQLVVTDRAGVIRRIAESLDAMAEIKR